MRSGTNYFNDQLYCQLLTREVGVLNRTLCCVLGDLGGSAVSVYQGSFTAEALRSLSQAQRKTKLSQYPQKEELMT
jgi:hypothetical protein